MTSHIDWLSILDPAAAASTVRTDISGDWHRDPWLWPELEWLVEPENHDLLVARLNSTGIAHSMPLDVAKEHFALRPAMVFDILDRLIYECLVGKLSARFIGDAPPWVYSWRLHRTAPVAGQYNALETEWKKYRQSMKQLSSYYEAALTTDVVSYFASIDIIILSEQILSRAGRSAVSNRLIDMLEGWSHMAQRSGLPQRANGSSILACLYLHSIDDLITSYGVLNSRWSRYFVPDGTAATRWVDDIWLFGNEVAILRGAQLDIQQAMQHLQLNMNLAKTQVYEGDEMVERVRNLEHSAVDQALLEDDANTGPLQEMVERCCADPENSNKTTIRFAAVRVRRHGLEREARKLLEVAHRMPQAAESLARLFFESGLWREASEWFVWYAASPWGKVDWAVAQFGRMFPAGEKGPADVQGLLELSLERGCSLSRMALAAHRLAAWNPERARLVFRSVLDRSHHPLERRVLAMAGILAGEERSWVRSTLGEFNENQITLRYLECRDFRPSGVYADFGGS